jgi:hypothetical protein
MWDPKIISQAAGVAGYQQPELPPLQSYQTSNPTALSAADASRAWANANGMRAQAEKVENAPGGSLVDKPQPAATASSINALEAAPDKPQQNAAPEAQGMSSLGSALGAVANFYTGNYAGMAQSLSNMGAKTTTDPANQPQGAERGEVSKPSDGKQAVSGLLGGLFGGGGESGGGAGGMLGGGGGSSGGGMDSGMLTKIMGMFGGG